jgi:hypothetical protein
VQSLLSILLLLVAVRVDMFVLVLAVLEPLEEAEQVATGLTRF